MKKNLLLTFALATFFGLGFAANSLINKLSGNDNTKRVTGIGGIFFKCKDPKKMKEWYEQNLGLDGNPWGGATFDWYEGADSTKKGKTMWQPFPATTKYFEPSTNDYMIDYRVADLDALVKEFKKNGVTIVDTMQTVDYGKFIHILDAEGNKVELWQPLDH